MKFFDVLPQLAENELLKRGVMTDELLYCVKADLDGEGGYVDVYITFTKTPFAYSVAMKNTEK